MEDYKPGHLDCLFDCGLTFSDLETLHFHIELDHREDNDISPFLARPESPLVATSSGYLQAPPLPMSAPPQVPVHDNSTQGSRTSEVEPYTLCPDPHCGEQILLIELNEHLNLHEAERLIDEGSTSESDNNRDQTLTSYSSAPISRNSSEPSQGQIHNISTDISPALKRKMGRREFSETGLRVGLARKFLSMIGIETKQSGQPDASRSKVPRLSVSTNTSMLNLSV
jgi:hypothetical protein